MRKPFAGSTASLQWIESRQVLDGSQGVGTGSAGSQLECGGWALRPTHDAQHKAGQHLRHSTAGQQSQIEFKGMGRAAHEDCIEPRPQAQHRLQRGTLPLHAKMTGTTHLPTERSDILLRCACNASHGSPTQGDWQAESRRLYGQIGEYFETGGWWLGGTLCHSNGRCLPFSLVNSVRTKAAIYVGVSLQYKSNAASGSPGDFLEV